MRAPPPDELETSALVGFLADAWGLDVKAAEYAAVGGGSYHWVVSDLDGPCGFVTADDLHTKPWLEDVAEPVFEGLRRAFATAVALRGSGLDFVVAPLPTSRGEPLHRVGPRYTVALFPLVDGQAGRYGRYEPGERAAVVTMLAELHRATPAVASVARRIDLDLPGRRYLDAALRELNQTWLGGPFSEPARQALAGHASDVTELLALLDRLAADIARHDTGWVVTHGEPHAANVMRTGESYVLVDWDTVALAPAERDLWMLVSDTGEEAAAAYADATGRRLDQAAVDYFRLTWDLGDLASFLNELRSPHRDDEDTAKAFDGLTYCVAIRDRWAALLT